MTKTGIIPFKFLNAALDLEDKCFENESMNVGIAKTENAGIASAISSISNAEIGFDFAIICDDYD